MNAFALTLQLHGQDADLSAMLQAWMELSESKGWPQTEEGWRRYLARMKDNGGFPKRSSKKAVTEKVAIPDGFTEWWKQHPHAGFDGDFSVAPSVAFRCERYRSEWEGRKDG
ncbi:MAG: hypothetical protein IAE97_10550 [Chthoniobacterales bacterium]|nr:hypothetical protein [Chthoniobacterales bacterium]